MENRKTHLINSLKVAIDALKNDTIHYSWSEQKSCNAGVVSQAILGISAEELETLRLPMFEQLSELNKNEKDKTKRYDLTWKNAIKHFCPITGQNMPQVIRDLEASGMNRSDIVHLEYLENPAILELSGIEKEDVYEDVVIGTKLVSKRVSHPNSFLAFFGIKTTIQEVVNEYEERVTGIAYPQDYHTKKENLIKYLVGWVKVLEGNFTYDNNIVDLEAKLINAVAEENYVEAARLRDAILLG